MEWSEIRIGTQARIFREIFREDIEEFMHLTGDFNPIHYKSNVPVVFGMLTTSFVSTLIGEHLPGHGAVIASTTFDYLSRVYMGDTLCIIGIVKLKSEAMRTLVVDIQIKNQNDVEVVNGTVMVVAL